MRGFQATEAGWQAILEPEEARILLSLSRQLQSLLADSLDQPFAVSHFVRGQR